MRFYAATEQLQQKVSYLIIYSNLTSTLLLNLHGAELVCFCLNYHPRRGSKWRGSSATVQVSLLFVAMVQPRFPKSSGRSSAA